MGLVFSSAKTQMTIKSNKLDAFHCEDENFLLPLCIQNITLTCIIENNY